MLLKSLFILLLCFGSINTDEETITWNASKKLTWNDFKGAIETSSDAVAVTASGITFSFAVKTSNERIVSFDAKAQAHFYPEKSWYIEDKGDDHILAHEQLHFDITELHVRILRYRISKLKVSQHIRDDLNAIHRQTNKELAEMQNQYDLQSQNSINIEQQAKWADFVKESLLKYRSFKSVN